MIREFFQDYENSYSQKRLQIFLAFVFAVVFGFMEHTDIVVAFLTYGSLNTFACQHETTIMKGKNDDK